MKIIKFLSVMIPFFVLLLGGCENRFQAMRIAKERGMWSALSQVLMSQNFRRVNGKNSKLYSWRFGLDAGVLGTENIDLELGWQSKENDIFRANSHYIYCFEEGSTNTNIFAITGSGTIFDASMGYQRDDIHPNLIVLIEVGNSDTHWMEPGDFDVDTMPKKIVDLSLSKNELVPVVSSSDSSGFLVGFGDGEVWKLSYQTEFEKLEPFFTVESAKAIDRSKELGKWRVDFD